MSIVTRLLGIGSCLLGGWMIGYVQGLQSIVEAAGNIVVSVATNTPNVGALLGITIAGFVYDKVNPAIGAYWAFGTILVLAGLLLIMLGDRKKRTPQFEPLLPNPA